MNTCAICNGNIDNFKGPYRFKTKNIGIVEVPDIEYRKCSKCGEKLLSHSASQLIFDYVKNEEAKCIGRLPIKDFITVAEAIDLLGFTKQAFSKNPKIKRGFIYGITKGNRTLYHKKSVLLFKEKKDGRFKIANPSAYQWNHLNIIRNKSKWKPTGYTADDSIKISDNSNERQENGYALEA